MLKQINSNTGFKYIYVEQGRAGIVIEGESIADGLFTNSFTICCVICVYGINHNEKKTLALAHIDTQFPQQILLEIIKQFKSTFKVSVFYKTESMVYSKLKQLEAKGIKINWMRVEDNQKGITVALDKNQHDNSNNNNDVQSKQNKSDTVETSSLLIHPKAGIIQSLYMAYDALFLSAPENIQRVIYDGNHWMTPHQVDLEATALLYGQIKSFDINKNDKISLIATKISEVTKRDGYEIPRQQAISRAFQVGFYLAGADKEQFLCLFFKAMVGHLENQNAHIPTEFIQACTDKKIAHTIVNDTLTNHVHYSQVLKDLLLFHLEIYHDPTEVWNLYSKAEKDKQQKEKLFIHHGQNGLKAYQAKDYPSAINYYTSALKICREIYTLETKETLNTYYNLGSALLFNNQPKEAIIYLNYALDLAKLILKGKGAQSKEKYLLRFNACKAKLNEADASVSKTEESSEEPLQQEAKTT